MTGVTRHGSLSGWASGLVSLKGLGRGYLAEGTARAKGNSPQTQGGCHFSPPWFPFLSWGSLGLDLTQHVGGTLRSVVERSEPDAAAAPSRALYCPPPLPGHGPPPSTSLLLGLVPSHPAIVLPPGQWLQPPTHLPSTCSQPLPCTAAIWPHLPDAYNFPWLLWFQLSHLQFRGLTAQALAAASLTTSPTLPARLPKCPNVTALCHAMLSHTLGPLPWQTPVLGVFSASVQAEARPGASLEPPQSPVPLFPQH